MSSLRLKATGERLVWRSFPQFGEHRLTRESDENADYAVVTNHIFEVYRCAADDVGAVDRDPDGYFSALLAGPAPDFAEAQRTCADELIEAGVAEVCDD